MTQISSDICGRIFIVWEGPGEDVCISVMTRQHNTHLLVFHSDFWEFYDGIRRNMPQECARNVQRVVKYFDNEVKSGRDVADLKEALGFPDIKHISDVAQMSTFSWRF